MDGRGRRSRSGPARPATPDDSPGTGPGRLSTYRIRVEGHLDDRAFSWPAGTSVTRELDGDTVLTVPPLDQAALLGLLRTLRDIGARLISVNPTQPGHSESATREDRS